MIAVFTVLLSFCMVGLVNAQSYIANAYYSPSHIYAYSPYDYAAVYNVIETDHVPLAGQMASVLGQVGFHSNTTGKDVSAGAGYAIGQCPDPANPIAIWWRTSASGPFNYQGTCYPKGLALEVSVVRYINGWTYFTWRRPDTGTSCFAAEPTAVTGISGYTDMQAYSYLKVVRYPDGNTPLYPYPVVIKSYLPYTYPQINQGGSIGLSPVPNPYFSGNPVNYQLYRVAP